jgi:hypothetical protein
MLIFILPSSVGGNILDELFEETGGICGGAMKVPAFKSCFGVDFFSFDSIRFL